jgi:integrase
MANLPKNIYQVTYKNKDGKKQFKYQVKKILQGKQYNKLFETVSECEIYLKEVNSHFGRKNVVEYDEQEQRKLEEFRKPPFEWFFMQYFNYKHPSNFDPKDLLKKKAYRTYQSFFKTILNTKIEVHNEEILEETPQASIILMGLGLGIKSKHTSLGKLKLHEINYKTINSYIKARLKIGNSKITIKKHLSILSCFFQECRYIDGIAEKAVENIGNPTKQIDKKLLANAFNVKKAKRIDEENWLKLMECYNKEDDLTFHYVSLLQYFGALRMSEALGLTWENISFNNKTLNLPKTKTTPRVVFMTKDLNDLLETIEPEKQNRTGLVVKNTGLYKYEKQIQRFGQRYGFYKIISTHNFRKDAISRMIDRVGGSNPMQLAQILGYKNVQQFQADYINDTPNIDTLSGIMKNNGQKQLNTVSTHYYELPKLK